MVARDLGQLLQQPRERPERRQALKTTRTGLIGRIIRRKGGAKRRRWVRTKTHRSAPHRHPVNLAPTSGPR
jgi:hypothetical protein